MKFRIPFLIFPVFVGLVALTSSPISPIVRAAQSSTSSSATSSSATSSSATSSSATSTRFLDPATISQRTLPNGVRGVVQENPGSDLVSVQVWVRAGSRFETKDNNGVTHLIETLALRSAKSAPAATSGARNANAQNANARNASTPAARVENYEPRAAIEALGGRAGSLTSRDSLFYSATLAAPFLPQALRLLAAATLAPDLSDAKVEAAKDELLDELASNNDPLKNASDLAYFTAFEVHPYRQPAQGTPAGVAALTGNKVRQYFQSRFAGGNISVVITGDVAREAGHKLIAQYFGGAPRVAQAPAIADDKPLRFVQRDSRRGNLPVSTLAFGFRAPAISKPADVVAADVLLAHWSEGRQAGLRKVLRSASLKDEAEDEEDAAPNDQSPAAPAPNDSTPDDETADNAPLALGFDVDYLTQRDAGLFLITIVAPRDRALVTSAILEELARVQAEGLTDDEMARAKNLLRHQYIEQGESVGGQAGSLGFYEMIDSYRFAVAYLDNIARVSSDDIKRVATEYLKPGAHVQALIEGVRPPLEQPDTGTITARIFE